jgi:hypothetical protein
MFSTTAEKLELDRLLSRAQSAEGLAEKADLLRQAAAEAGNWAKFHNRRSLEISCNREGENENHF